MANKADLPKALSIDDVRVAFGKVLSGRTACIFKTSVIQSIAQGGFLDAFDWLRFALSSAASGSPTPPTSPHLMPDARSSTQLTAKVESWLARVETDSDPKEFLDQFQSISLPQWDHYTHIRIAFLLLTRYGRKKGKFPVYYGRVSLHLYSTREKHDLRWYREVHSRKPSNTRSHFPCHHDLLLDSDCTSWHPENLALGIFCVVGAISGRKLNNIYRPIWVLPVTEPLRR